MDAYPRIRYYSQDAADFYTTGFVTKQGYKNKYDANGNRIFPSYDPSKFQANFSSDQRLSGYGALSGGLTITKKFTKGVTLETGFEYYTHQGALKIGGGGEETFADYNFWVANAALKVDLATLSMAGAGSSADHTEHLHHQGANAPAGVMFAHMLPKAGDFMLGYRYMYGSQGGNMLHGSNPISDAAIVNNGCVEPGG